MSDRYEELAANLNQLQSEISSYSPNLIAVTKTYPVSDVEILYELGLQNFGENRSSEGLAKSTAIPANWHYQGEIQSKKIREITSWADCIHSLDETKHAERISRCVVDQGGEIDIFLQLSLDGDPSRGGVVESDLYPLAYNVNQLPGINLLGIMSVPPVELEPGEAFQRIAQVHQRFKREFPESPYLSAGMSGDYMVALSYGATHIRVGSKILGARTYR